MCPNAERCLKCEGASQDGTTSIWRANCQGETSWTYNCMDDRGLFMMWQSATRCCPCVATTGNSPPEFEGNARAAEGAVQNSHRHQPERTCAGVVVLCIGEFRKRIASEVKLVKKVFLLHMMEEVSTYCGATRRMCQGIAGSNTLKLEIFHGAAECAHSL